MGKHSFVHKWDSEFCTADSECGREWNCIGRCVVDLGETVSNISDLQLCQYVVCIFIRQVGMWHLCLVGNDKRGLHLVTTQGRMAGHHLWVYQSSSKMVTETVLGTGVKLAILEQPSAREHFIEVFIMLFLCDLCVSFPRAIIFVIYIYIFFCSLFVSHTRFQLTHIDLV